MARLWQIVLVVSALVLSALATACGESTDPDGTSSPVVASPPATSVTSPDPSGAIDPALRDATWSLRAMHGADVLPDVAVTLEITQQGLSGSDGCNFYSAESVEIGDGVLRIQSPGFTQTAMSCADDVMAQAASYTDALRQADRYRLADGRLQVIDATGHTLLVFSDRMQDALAGPTWLVGSMQRMEPDGGRAGYGLIEGTQISVTFNVEDGGLGRIEGNSGCNHFSGRYAIDDWTLSISDVSATEMACPDPPGVMEQEQEFLDNLRRVVSWTVAGTRLNLTMDDERGMELTALR